MLRTLLSILFLVSWTTISSCSIEPFKDKSDDNSPDEPDEVACTLEAKVICRETSTGEYTSTSVGRQGPDCEFPTYEDEVDYSLCDGGVACTDDAKLVCRETSAGVFSSSAVGREGPDCTFPTFEDEVDYSHCEED